MFNKSKLLNAASGLVLAMTLALGGFSGTAGAENAGGISDKGNNVKIYDHGVSWEKDYGVTQAYSVNGIVYISGQFSHDMKGAFVGEGDIKAQTRQTLENLDRVLAGFGLAKSNLAEVEVFMANPKRDFEPFIALYREYMGDHRAAGTLIGVSSLAFPEELVEIRAVAHAN